MTAEADVGTQTEVIGRRNVSFMPYFVYSPPPDNISRTVVERFRIEFQNMAILPKSIPLSQPPIAKEKQSERRYNAKRGWGLDVKQ